jgi:hypothetical protein
MFLAVTMATPFAFAANELDNEALIVNKMQRFSELPQTTIVRVNEKTKAVEVAVLEKAVDEGDIKPEDFAKLNFKAIKENQALAKTDFPELDSDKASSSWYFYWGWNYSYYNYWGYNYWYTPYYSYNYWGWNYWYYRPCWC